MVDKQNSKPYSDLLEFYEKQCKKMSDIAAADVTIGRLRQLAKEEAQ